MQVSIESCQCGGSPVTLEGEIICSNCGIVMDNPFPDFGPEIRAFNQAQRDRRTRTGTPLSPAIHDKGLTTMISRIGRDAFGRKIKQEDKVKMMRLKKWNIRSRVQSSEDRNLAQAMNILDRLSEGLNLPFHVKENAALIYRQTLAAKLVRGRSIEAIIAAATYVAIRQNQLPRTLREVTAQTSYPLKDISRCYRLILKTLNIRPPRADAKIFISKIGNGLGLSQKVQRDAFDLLVEAKAKRLTVGKDPAGLAASAIYISCLMNNSRTNQKDIGEAAGCTEVTIRNRYRGLVEDLKIDKSKLGRIHLNRT